MPQAADGRMSTVSSTARPMAIAVSTVLGTYWSPHRPRAAALCRFHVRARLRARTGANRGRAPPPSSSAHAAGLPTTACPEPVGAPVRRVDHGVRTDGPAFPERLALCGRPPFLSAGSRSVRLSALPSSSALPSPRPPLPAGGLALPAQGCASAAVLASGLRPGCTVTGRAGPGRASGNPRHSGSRRAGDQVFTGSGQSVSMRMSSPREDLPRNAQSYSSTRWPRSFVLTRACA